MQVEKDAYDAVEYPSYAFPDTHPDHLAAMALLYGLEPPPVESCRVLEVGCNEGANLIPMAYAIPGGEFVGFDLAGLPVARAQERTQELGLKNIRIFQANLLDASPELGEFDYIIAHGLYAWIPEPVRDGLLALCKRHLAPNGVAFISYNALPGGYLRMMARDMMLFRTRGIEDPEHRLSQGIEFIRLLAETRTEGTLYRELLEEQAKRLGKNNPHAVYHDDFSPAYRPVYFSQFVEHAKMHGLQYLTDAELPPPNDPCFNANFQNGIKSAVAGDLIAQEQMVDFARMRMFRETLLCHAERPLKHSFPAELFRRLLFASSLVSIPNEADDAEGVRRYAFGDGSTKLCCDQPATIAVLDKLIPAWPHALTFDDIAPELAENGISDPRGETMLLLQMAVSKMVELHAWSPTLAAGVAEQPKATATSRQEAHLHDHAATLWHFQVQLTDETGRYFLQLLDGTRNHDTLLEALKAKFPAIPLEDLKQSMEQNLKFIYRAALLEA